MSTKVSTGQITVVDTNDTVVSSSAPPSAVLNQLWLDTSTNPPTLKICTSVSPVVWMNVQYDDSVTVPSGTIAPNTATFSTNKEGTVDITFTWSYTPAGGTVPPSDGFYIFYEVSDTSPTATPSTASTCLATQSLTSRKFTLTGVSGIRYHSFSICEFRDTSSNTLTGTLVTGTNWTNYRPLATIPTWQGGVIPTTTVAPSSAGLALSSDYMGFYNGGWQTYIGNDGRFSFNGSDSSHHITWDGTTLDIRGKITADDVTSGVFTGRSFKTANSGERLEIDATTNCFNIYNTTSPYPIIQIGANQNNGSAVFSLNATGEARGGMFSATTYGAGIVAQSQYGSGVVGTTIDPTSVNPGIYGTSFSKDAAAVQAINSRGGGAVYAQTYDSTHLDNLITPPQGTAIYARSTIADVVVIENYSVSGNGLYVDSSIPSNTEPSIYSVSNSSTAPAITGEGLNGGVGVYGTSINNYGIKGNSSSTNGVYGTTGSDYAAAILGETNSTSHHAGVYGKSNSPSGFGIYGYNAVGGYAGYLYAAGSANGLNINASGSSGYGLNIATDTGMGLNLTSNTSHGIKVVVGGTGVTYGSWSINNSTHVSSAGMYAQAASGYGIYASSTSGYGGAFIGNATKAPLKLGTLTALPTDNSAGAICYLTSGPGGAGLYYADGTKWWKVANTGTGY